MNIISITSTTNSTILQSRIYLTTKVQNGLTGETASSKNQPETPSLIVTDFSKWLHDDDDGINWSTTDIYGIPDIELRYKKKVISLSPTQPRSDGYQQPQLTVLCPIPAASTVQVLPGLTAWREGPIFPSQSITILVLILTVRVMPMSTAAVTTAATAI